MTSRYSKVPFGARLEAFSLVDTFNKDPFDKKVSLVIGVYRDYNAKPWVLPVVSKAESELSQRDDLDKEYLPGLGDESFIEATNKLLFGEDHVALKEKRVLGIQTISASGGLRLGADFLSKVLNYTTFYISEPTYANHERLFLHGGLVHSRRYRYWSKEKCGLDIDGLLEDLRNAPTNSVILLHACAHNPTGCDPTEEQWIKIADVIEERKLFPFFDCAYQGFATGDLAKDAWSVRHFANRGIELFCAQTFSKNFGLYSDRVGNLCTVLKNPQDIEKLKSHFSLFIRGMYKDPPATGARIVAHILNNPQLYDEWQQNMITMAGRMQAMRLLLRKHLEEIQTPGDWSHITSQIGMFSYTGLTQRQSERMVDKYHVYMLKSGRISMCGITTDNVEYVAKAINETLRTIIE